MQITQKSKTDIAINCFRRGGGMESYTFDLVRGLRTRGAEIAVYAAQADPAVPEYNQVEIHRINQQIIPKKLRPYFFTRQLVHARRGRNVPLIACNPSDHADIFVCGGTHLGYLHNMGERPGLLDRLTIRRNRSNYATAKSASSIRPPTPPASIPPPMKPPPSARNTAFGTTKPCSCSPRPATSAKDSICWRTFSNTPTCPSNSPSPVRRCRAP